MQKEAISNSVLWSWRTSHNRYILCQHKATDDVSCYCGVQIWRIQDVVFTVMGGANAIKPKRNTAVETRNTLPKRKKRCFIGSAM